MDNVQYFVEVSQQYGLSLSKDSIFPKGSHLRQLVDSHFGNVLVALWRIIASHHPAKMEQPTTFIRSPPSTTTST